MQGIASCLRSLFRKSHIDWRLFRVMRKEVDYLRADQKSHRQTNARLTRIVDFLPFRFPVSKRAF